MTKFAVISFPGTNCEEETIRAFKRAGMDAEMVLWNDPGALDRSRLDEFVGYCIAGGFSYEDRGRSGIVAAQEPITNILREEAKKGKVILGICNGAQVLVETGLIPGFDDQTVGMALSWNEMKQNGEVVDTGYYNIWCRMKNMTPKKRCAFNDFDELLHVPIAHGEGRFMIESELVKQLEANDQIVFKYCDAKGELDPNFPVNPNGATRNIAAICNPEGNVMAMMPHPERDPMGNGQLIFDSIKRWIDSPKKTDDRPLSVLKRNDEVTPLPTFDLEIYVRLIITDNAERTIEEALKRNGIDLTLERYEFFGIDLESDQNSKQAAEKIIESGELANLNKHQVYVKINDEMFDYSKEQGLIPSDLSFVHRLITSAKGDFVGEHKKEALDRHATGIAKGLHYGILWNFVDTDPAEIQKAIQSNVLHNPFSMTLMK